MPLNIAHFLPEMAAACPWRRAVVYPHGRDRYGRVSYTHLTFRQLDQDSDRYAWGLARLGVSRGMRVLLMVRPGLDFVGVTFALFKLGAVPVLIDPGMGWRGFVHCVAEARPEVFLGIPAAQVCRWLCPSAFRTVRISATLGSSRFWPGRTLHQLCLPGPAFEPAATQPDEMAAILFTTGSTGPAKGVVYTHGIFDAQVRIIQRQYAVSGADVDLSCFPLFALFSVAMGMTTVVPDMDASRPGSVNPRRIVEAVRNQGVTFSFGSPTLWRRVAEYCAANRIALPSLRRVLMAGAPVPGDLHELLLNQVLAPGAETYTPYGATEALPVSSFSGTEAMRETWARSRQGAGICVGTPLPEMCLRIIGIREGPIDRWDESLVLPPGEVGEIVVKGPVVTPRYDARPDQTRLAKIPEGNQLWHRLGDAGYRDENGRVWFCGRLGQRVTTPAGTMYTVPCEAVFNQHPLVFRSALVGVGPDRCRQMPVLVVQPRPGRFPRRRSDRDRFVAELRELGRHYPHTAAIEQVLFHPRFPVDIRHNAKIRREMLALWAAPRVTLKPS